MNFTIDRTLPVPVGLQLKGLIEYGIACGHLDPGVRLPSVRELAETLQIAPMTVSRVYAELRRGGMLETRPGDGTFVGPGATAGSPSAFETVRRQIDRLIDRATAAGMARAELAGLFSARLNGYGDRARRVRLTLVGVFQPATAAYADAIREHLGPGDAVDAVTLDVLASDPDSREAVRSSDLVVTFANRRAEVAALLGDGPPVVVLRFIPSERTRIGLAGIDPRARLGLVSALPDFLATMKGGIAQHAAHVAEVRATVLGAEHQPELLSWAEMVVYSTGAEAVLAALTGRQQALEYRHTPDPRSIEQTLLPAIEGLRRGAAAPRHLAALQEAS